MQSMHDLSNISVTCQSCIIYTWEKHQKELHRVLANLALGPLWVATSYIQYIKIAWILINFVKSWFEPFLRATNSQALSIWHTHLPPFIYSHATPPLLMPLNPKQGKKKNFLGLVKRAGQATSNTVWTSFRILQLSRQLWPIKSAWHGLYFESKSKVFCA